MVIADSYYQNHVRRIFGLDLSNESALKFRGHMLTVILKAVNDQGVGLLEVSILLFEAVFFLKYLHIG